MEDQKWTADLGTLGHADKRFQPPSRRDGLMILAIVSVLDYATCLHELGHVSGRYQAVRAARPESVGHGNMRASMRCSGPRRWKKTHGRRCGAPKSPG